MPFSRHPATLLSACLLAFAAASSPGQTRAATRTKYVPPVYPENASKNDLQGNVLLIGRIDKQGNVSDLHLDSASLPEFVQPALESVRVWKFSPALRDGRPVEIALNAGVRFRVTGKGRGQIPTPTLGDLAVFPADSAGAKTAPEGFPLRKGKDAALRAEVLLDVPPAEQARTLGVRIEAVSPKGRKVPVFQPPLAVPALAAEVNFPVVAPVGADWEEGVWMLQVAIDGQSAGGGQFWLATDPATFPFVLPTLRALP
jgi:TonB family protein